MSTWISDALRSVRRVGLALTLPLAGCVGEGTSPGGMGFLSPPEGEAKPLSRRVLPQMSLYGGRIVVVPPKGYCIDGSAASRGIESSVLLIASCATLKGTREGNAVPAVMTVSVSPRRSGAQQPTSATLATSLAPARVSSVEDGDDISLVRVNSDGDGVLPAGDPRYWRAGMLINGHIVMLAAYTPRGSRTSGKALIMDLADNLREFSPVRDYTPVASTTGETGDEES